MSVTTDLRNEQQNEVAGKLTLRALRDYYCSDADLGGQAWVVLKAIRANLLAVAVMSANALIEVRSQETRRCSESAQRDTHRLGPRTDDFQILAGYSYSKTIDDASYDSEQPQNPYALSAEQALSLQDQRHRVTLSGLWLIGPDLNDPQDAAANAHPGPIMRLLTGLEFAPIFSVSSGFRANPIVGVDSNREHIYPFAARPQGNSRNSLFTSQNINLDLRALKMIPLGSGHLDVVAESFNLLNHSNITLLNTSFGSRVQPGAGFTQAIGASSPRRIQFSLDYEF